MKLFASDLDGTLLNEHFGISPLNLHAIHKLSDHDIVFAVATGRIYHDAMTICKSRGLHPYIISNNGACAFDTRGSQIYGCPIELSQLRELKEYLEDIKVCYGIGDSGIYAAPSSWEQVFDGEIHRLSRENIHIPPDKAAFAKYEMTAQNGFCALDFEDGLNSRGLTAYSVSVVTYDESKIRDIINFVGRFPNLTATVAGSHSLEIMRRDGTKGDALRFLAETLNIKRSETGAIGDSLNDISMLLYAGVSVAMGNARDEVKKICSFTTDVCQNDGFAQAIERLTFTDGGEVPL